MEVSDQRKFDDISIFHDKSDLLPKEVPNFSGIVVQLRSQLLEFKYLLNCSSVEICMK